MARSGVLAARDRRREARETGSADRSSLIHALVALARHFHAHLWQSPVAVLLALSLLAVNALALQPFRDQTSSPGIYDDDDLDDALVLLSDPSQVAGPPCALGPIAPGGMFLRLAATTASATSAVPASLARHFRSPPLP